MRRPLVCCNLHLLGSWVKCAHQKDVELRMQLDSLHEGGHPVLCCALVECLL